jgi:drug/metabolite transporter (DMT)-like permease
MLAFWQEQIMVRALFLITVFVWGTSWYAMRLQIGLAPVEVSIAYRFVLGTLLLGAGLLLSGRLRRVPGRAHVPLALMGLCMFGLNFFLIYNSAFYIATGLASVIFTLSALFNSLNQWIFFRKAPDARVIAGCALGTLGVLCLSSDQLTSTSPKAWIGILLALGGTYFFSLGNMASVRITAMGVDLPNAIIRAMAWGVAASGLSSLATGQVFVLPNDLGYWLALFWLALGSTVIGFLSYLSLVNRLGADRAAYVSVLFPLIALSISTLLEKYQWHWLGGLGIISILAGCVLVFTRPALNVVPNLDDGNGRKPLPERDTATV